FANLFADLTPVWMQRVQIAPEQIERFAGRLLFGSDAPNNPVGAREQAASLEAAEISAEALALLLGGTAARLVPVELAEAAP
ncbi:MAG TPA: amidohydrolase family protein, partial [Dehalococcoidia bacterium]|nr:amidohydrolase family protein [Dehalococcoidia bacterium]